MRIIWMIPNYFGANLPHALCVESDVRSHDDTNSEDLKILNFQKVSFFYQI